MKKRYLKRKEKKRKDLFFKHTHLQARARCARDLFFEGKRIVSSPLPARQKMLAAIPCKGLYR
ncbi:MAG: hypothetical protein MR890_09085 [Akkermansia muciniphila]|nr:hypothetical protein [Akkermansia muciniphila]